uniref:Hypothetical secreted protein n=1 Tax=Triatoma matogrossensis TaxID=162370 RepID=E2J7C9_9HEMI
MKVIPFVLFVIHYVHCRPNSVGNVIQGYIVTPPSSLPTFRGQTLVYPSSQYDHATLNDLVPLAIWNPLYRNGLQKSIYPGQFGYPPVPYILYPTPSHPMILPLSPVDSGKSFPNLGEPVLKLIPYPLYGNGLEHPSLIPPDTTGNLLNGYYIPIITTTTVQTEEVV